MKLQELNKIIEDSPFFVDIDGNLFEHMKEVDVIDGWGHSLGKATCFLNGNKIKFIRKFSNGISPKNIFKGIEEFSICDANKGPLNYDRIKDWILTKYDNRKCYIIIGYQVKHE